VNQITITDLQLESRLMRATDDPAIPRRKLKGELRAARTAAGLTRDEAAKHLDWSLSKLVRIETGDQGVSVTDLRAMLQLYKSTDETFIAELTKLARSSRRQAWWAGHRDVISKQFGLYLSYEGSASAIRTFHPLLIPGLLHTDDYAFHLLRTRLPEENARSIIDLRMERQERLFDQPEPPRTAFIFGEEALTRCVGGQAVMRHQLRHVLEMAQKDTVSIQVVPFSAGAHPGLIGSFILVSLPDSGEDLLFLEGAGGDIVNRDEEELINPFIDYFETLRGLALSEQETGNLIDRRIGQLNEAEGEGSASSMMDSDGKDSVP
jgi:transcriptional regulator with XRE-family HTH domain